MKAVQWSVLKSERLKATRGASFEDIISAKQGGKIKMRRIRLTREERAAENALLGGEYVDVPKREFDLIARSIASRKKDVVLNIRVNSSDLASIKARATKFGIKYQTFLSELIHRIAQGNLARN